MLDILPIESACVPVEASLGEWTNRSMFYLAQLKQALRRLARAPVFTGVTLLTLAVGVGATTAIFSVVESVVLKPLDYPRSEQLVGVWLNAPGFGIQKLGMAQFIYFIDREQSATLQDLGVYLSESVNVTGTGEPENVRGLVVTESTLPILGVHPVLGRLFSQQDDTPGAPDTVLISYAYWQQKFGGSASAIGRSIIVSAKPREVVGVLPRDFHFLDEADPALIFAMQWDRSTTKLGNFSYKAIARLKPGMTLAQANADQARLLPVAIHSFPPWEGFSTGDFEKARLGPDLHPLKEDVIGNISAVLWVLMGSIAIVLLIACANVANLLLVRVEGRRQELAIRYAVGAGPGHIAASILIDSLILGLAGSIVGLALTFGALRILVAMAPTGLPRLHEITIDVPVLLFTVGIALFVSFGIGMIPAIKYTRADLRSALSESGRGQSHSRERQAARKVLVAVQVALSLRTADLCRPDDPDVPGFGKRESRVRTAQHTRDISRVRSQSADPGHTAWACRSSGAANLREHSIGPRCLVGCDNQRGADGRKRIRDPIFVRDRTYKEGEIPPPRRFKFVSPGFFTAMGIPLIAGRDLTWSEAFEKRAVAIVSENLAREYWNDPASALGKQIRATSSDDWREIIGVVGNVRDEGLDQPESSAIYWPRLQDRFDGEKEFLLRDVATIRRLPRRVVLRGVG